MLKFKMISKPSHHGLLEVKSNGKTGVKLTLMFLTTPLERPTPDSHTLQPFLNTKTFKLKVMIPSTLQLLEVRSNSKHTQNITLIETGTITLSKTHMKLECHTFLLKFNLMLRSKMHQRKEFVEKRNGKTGLKTLSTMKTG